MKHLFRTALCAMGLLYAGSVMSQDTTGVAISAGEATPDPSAILDVISTTKGVLIPRMTTTQRNAISSPADGLMVYDTDVSSVYYYNETGTVWVMLSGSLWTESSGDIYYTGGKVGVGTSSPSHLLTVALPSGSTSGQGMRLQGQGGGYMDFVNTTSTSDYFSPKIVGVNSASGNNYGLQLAGQSSSDASTKPSILLRALDPDDGSSATEDAPVLAVQNGSTDVLRIDKDGKIGVGTTSPSYLLDVNGSLNATSIYLNGSPFDGADGNGIYDGSGSLGANTTVTTGGYQFKMTSTSGSTPTLELEREVNNVFSLNRTASGGGTDMLWKSEGTTKTTTGYYTNSSCWEIWSPTINNIAKFHMTTGDVAFGADPVANTRFMVASANATEQRIVFKNSSGNMRLNMWGQSLTKIDLELQTQSNTGSIWADTDHGIRLRTNNSDRLQIIRTTGEIGIGVAPTTGTELTIRGTGATSSTFGLLVEGSGGTDHFVVRDDGKVGIGTSAPSETLTVAGNTAPSADDSYSCGTSSLKWTAVYATNGSIQTSDRRLKTNIASLNYGLKEVMKLRPVRYNWTSDPNGNDKIGLIAQEVQPLVNEVVNVGEDENQTLGMNYAELVPVLIKAIQEQQKMIDELVRSNSDKEEILKSQNEKLNQLNEQLQKLVSAKASVGSTVQR